MGEEQLLAVECDVVGDTDVADMSGGANTVEGADNRQEARSRPPGWTPSHVRCQLDDAERAHLFDRARAAADTSAIVRHRRRAKGIRPEIVELHPTKVNARSLSYVAPKRMTTAEKW